MILRLRMVRSLYQKLISMDRRSVIDKLLFLFIRLPLPFERTDERRTSHAGDRIPLIILSLFKYYLLILYITLWLWSPQLQLLTLVSYSGFLLWLHACSGGLLVLLYVLARYHALGPCVYLLRMPLKFVSLLESLDIFRTMRLSLPHAGWGKMLICHAASLLEHRCSLIRHGNLAVLPRGERSKQNDT